jgi:sulfate transport system permease protein
MRPRKSRPPHRIFRARTGHNHHLNPGLRSLTLFYQGIIILIPVIALILTAFNTDVSRLFDHISNPQALSALKLTALCAVTIALVNCITGTATAWVLVRYEFPLKKTINTLIDLPFAVPTVVTGIMLVSIYGPQSIAGRFFSSLGIQIIFDKPGIILALLFVTFPFVVRSVQPVVMALDADMEEAAKSLGASPLAVFLKVILPELLPAILTGTALSFSRALGEFGSIVIVAGNIPMKTQVAAVYIFGEVESGNIPGALGISLILLGFSFLTILILNIIQRWRRKYE